MQIEDRIGHYKLSNRNWYKRDFADLQAITVHHDAIPHSNRRDNTILNQIKDTHIKKNWPGASYHFWIGRTGTVYQLNDVDWITWHDSKNTHSIGICVTGYFHPPHDNKPDKRQLSSLYELIRHLHEQYGKDLTVRGHRDVSSTACPGNHLYPLIHNYKQKDSNMITLDISGFSELEVSKESMDEVMRLNEEYQKERQRTKDARKERDELKKTVEFLETEKENLETSVKKLKIDVKETTKKLEHQEKIVANMDEACQKRIDKNNAFVSEFRKNMEPLLGVEYPTLAHIQERYKELLNQSKQDKTPTWSEIISLVLKKIKNE